MEDRRRKSQLIFITIGAFKYPILTIIASPIVADFQYVVYKYFTLIINVTDILLQFFWGRILYSLDCFSMIGFDQKHEQQNKELNMHGGNLNLSDECVFTEWDVAGPEIARVITELEAGILTRKNAVLKHHDQSPSVQQRFVAHTKALIIAFQEAGNPFDEDRHEVVIIDTR